MGCVRAFWDGLRPPQRHASAAQLRLRHDFRQRRARLTPAHERWFACSVVLRLRPASTAPSAPSSAPTPTPTPSRPRACGCNRDRLERAGRSPATIAKRLSALRALAGALGVDGVREVRGAKVARGEPRALSTDDYARLLRMPDLRTTAGKRDLALLHPLGTAGLRRAEACALLIADVDERPRSDDPRLRRAIKGATAWWVTVRYGKRGNRRHVPLEHDALTRSPSGSAPARPARTSSCSSAYRAAAASTAFSSLFGNIRGAGDCSGTSPHYDSAASAVDAGSDRGRIGRPGSTTCSASGNPGEGRGTGTSARVQLILGPCPVLPGWC